MKKLAIALSLLMGVATRIKKYIETIFVRLKNN